MVPHNRVRGFLFDCANLGSRSNHAWRRSTALSWQSDEDLFQPRRYSSRLAAFAPNGALCSNDLPSPTEEDIRLHGLLQERLMALGRRRRAWWSKFWRFIAGR
jgi:hypothetical protein